MLASILRANHGFCNDCVKDERKTRNFNFFGEKSHEKLRQQSDERIKEIRDSGYLVEEQWNCSFKSTVDPSQLLRNYQSPMLPKIDRYEMSESELIELIRTDKIHGFCLCSTELEFYRIH